MASSHIAKFDVLDSHWRWRRPLTPMFSGPMSGRTAHGPGAGACSTAAASLILNFSVGARAPFTSRSPWLGACVNWRRFAGCRIMVATLLRSMGTTNW